MKLKTKILFATLITSFSLNSMVLTADVEAKSLWSGKSNWTLYSDRKANSVGDILTIVINESTRTSTQKSTTNEKTANTSLGGGAGIFSFLAAAAASQSDSFEATGAASDVSSFAARITVTVTEVFPNGNMVVEGTQSIWQNKDEHKITIRGIVRQDDVLSNNTIPSTQVADATIRFDGKGPLNAKQRQGILTQIFNFLF